MDMEEAIGLVLLSSRGYPLLRRFISPDLFVLFEPERFLKTPQALNLYVYSINYPMLMSYTTPAALMAHYLIGVLVLLALPSLSWRSSPLPEPPFALRGPRSNRYQRSLLLLFSLSLISLYFIASS